MYCAHCGNEVQEKQGFCSKCGKQAGAPKPAVRVGLVATLLLVFFVGFGLVVHFIRADQAAANMQPSSPQVKIFTETMDTSFTVPKLGSHSYKFVVPAGINDAVLQGHLTATGGNGNDIEAWLMSDDEFVNWQNRHPVTPIYNSGRVTQATINVPLPQPGTYYLVFNNRFSFVSPKAVQDNVSLTYKR